MTVSAIEFSRLGPPKLHLYAMRCTTCNDAAPLVGALHLLRVRRRRSWSRSGSAGTGELTNYTVVYYPPRDFLGQEPYVVGHITMDEGVLHARAGGGRRARTTCEVGTRVKATLRRMKLGHEGDIYYSQKFVVDPDPPKREPAATRKPQRRPLPAGHSRQVATSSSSRRRRRGSAR